MVYTNLSKKKIWLFKTNKTRKHHILVMSTLLIGFLMVDVIGNLEFNPNLGNPENEFTKYLKTNDLTSDNTFTGIGAPWNVTHYANTTLKNIEVSFYNNSFDASNEINLDTGWMGYQLNSTITDLYTTRNVVNGTFHCGNFTGDSPSGNDDSDYVSDWTFNEYDSGYSNDMSGNYYDKDHSDGADCIELKIDGQGVSNFNYDQNDRCWWDANFAMPQGEITNARLYLALNPKYTGGQSGLFTLRVRINEEVLMARNLYAMFEHNGGSYWGLEKEDISNIASIFPEGADNVNITIEFTQTGATFTGDAFPSYGVLIDNVTLVVKTKSSPSDIELKLNGEQINDGIIQNEGSLGIMGNWEESVIANFSSDYIWPYVYEDEGNIISYKVEFTTDLALYINKTTPESYYLVDPDLDYQGSAFSVSNISDVSWITYAHMEIPSGYEETNLTVEFPSDYSLNGIFFSQDPNSLSETTTKILGNKKIVNIPVSSITTNTNGFWKLTAESPNYCEEMNLFNDASGDWEISNEFRSGDYLNVTAKISNSALVSGYIEETNARLQIRFPNGTIWYGQTQIKSVDNAGMVYFDPILIPDAEPNYEVGEYEAIVTWNNSYSVFGFNETGLIFKTFTVIHDSYLDADDDFFENIFEGDTIILRVSFSDANDNSAIRNANVSTVNFMDELKQFSEISPGYYILEFNTSGGGSGNNYLDITATHPLYEDNQIQITIELIFYTVLTAEEYPSLKVAWNTNFTVHFNYTYTSNGTGIKNADTTIDWNGDWSTKAENGLYNITFNSSRCEINKIYNLRLTFDKIGCESQTIIISIEIIARETTIGSILINDRDCITNKSVNIRYGELLYFKVTYNDLESSGTFINGATVTLNASIENGKIGENFDENPTFYDATINSTDLGQPTYYIINIFAKKANYTSNTIQLTINVFKRDTSYNIFLNGTDYTSKPEISLYTDQLLTIDVTYIDSFTTNLISEAMVDINGSGISEVLQWNSGNYSVTINTTNLIYTANLLTIDARKDGYERQLISLVIYIIPVESELMLYLNDELQTSTNPEISMYANQLLTIDVTYKERFSEALISGATVDINGSGISKVLLWNSGNYSVTINSTELASYANSLIIKARKDGYELQLLSLVIYIIPIESELMLYLNGELQATTNPEISMYTNQLLTIDVIYRELVSEALINGATVDINGSGISEVLQWNSGNYSITLNTTELNDYINILTIYARKMGYGIQSITFGIKIIQIESELILYLNGDEKTSKPEISMYTNQLLTIDVFYNELITTSLISGAIIDINGSGISANLDWDSGNYSITLNTTDLNDYINILTIYARKDGYEHQSISVTIQIKLRSTEMQILVNDEDITSTKHLEVSIGESLNITIKYKDLTSEMFISYATVRLLGTDLNLSLSMDLVHGQYYVIIDTEAQLDIGLKFLTIWAEKDMYQPLSPTISVEVQRIQGEIYEERFIASTERIINIRPGESVSLSIIVRDPIFEVAILDAYVTYTSAIGQGELLDPNNDGIFTGSIQNIVEGTHTITITVYAGDNYDFERYQFVISAARPAEETLLFQILTIVGVSAAIGVSGYLIAYQKVLKYPKQVRKIRKFRSNVKKDMPLDLEISSREQLIEQHYSEEIEPLEKQVKRKMSPKLSDAKLNTGEQEKPDNFDSNTSEK